MEFIEEFVRVAAPTERFWGWVLVVAALLMATALVWMIVQAARASTGWKRGLFWLLFLIPLLLAAATAALIFAGRRESGFAFLTALGTAACFLLVVLVVSFARWPLSRKPLLLFLAGLLLGSTPYVYTHLIEPIVVHYFRPPYVSEVDGELHVTLTGIPNYDYAKLARFPDVAVLQMANPEVTDDTLKNLGSLPRLKELDLNDTSITDAGLAEIKRFPALERLRLKNTKITDAGFRTHLLELDNLYELDMRETAVKSKTLREWKSNKKSRKYLK